MKFFFDTEFLEDGKTIELISIGIVAEDGREYYAVSSEFDRLAVWSNPWLFVHVTPHLNSMDLWKPRKQIASEIIDFVGEWPEFWADYASYDWVALCQLYGCMIDLPPHWPMYCRDIQQALDAFNPRPDFPITNPIPHHALYDARECRDWYKYLSEKSEEIPDNYEGLVSFQSMGQHNHGIQSYDELHFNR